MYFKKLELFGFKSFADKTVIEFQPGVTAIVGPNGCGKSNVADAIRWVLGEQSAKSLRGSSMEDVIFSGSADKEPLNLSQVSLTFSNESRILPIEYDEVTIARRLYRSGESEYLLNDNLVRLKDIHELLLGTGIGTESYSLIEQGKMDAVLASKPEDRRTIFEEAAGITKFKAKKKEALRKLEQTDQNLLRINDIIQEVKRQIGSIERQAKKAEAYKVDFEKLKTLELAVASREFLIFDRERRSREEELAALKAQEAEKLAAAREYDRRCAEERATLDRQESALRGASSEEIAVAADIRSKQDRILLNRERIGELAEKRGQFTRQSEEIGKRLGEFDSEARALDAELQAAASEEAAGGGFLKSAEEAFGALDATVQAARRREEEARGEISRVAEERGRHGRDFARLEAESQAHQARLRRLHHEEEGLLKEIREIDERFAATLFSPSTDAQGSVGGQPASRRYEELQQKFRANIVSLFRRSLEKPAPSFGAEEESALEREIRAYSDEISSLQGALAEERAVRAHADEAKVKLETRLRRLADETRSLADEEAAQRARLEELHATARLFDSRESAAAAALQEALEAARSRAGERETLLMKLAETRSRQADFESRRRKIEKEKQWLVDSRRAQEELRASLLREAEESVTKRASLEAESAQMESAIGELSVRRDEAVRKIESCRRDREETLARLSTLDAERAEREKFLREASEKVHAFEMQSAELRFSMDRLKERIFDAYQIELESQKADSSELDLEEAKSKIHALREKLAKMGPVNLVAIEEHEEMRQRFEFLTKQEQDLVQAKDDLMKAIQKINRTTKELFAETFEKTRQYFGEYFRTLFGGGQADLVLLDEQDILESGIEIVARPPGKKLQSITLLSGGEKALTAVALVFALFRVKPSPFCVLDEIDAPLDESNVDRFCQTLKSFITGSQFILITHNKRTMNLADALYGITMAQTGISRVVSVKFDGRAETKPAQRTEEAVA